MQVETGQHVGDGGLNRQIAVSFQPDWVWINNVSMGRSPVVRHKDYGANLSNYPGFRSGMIDDAIKSFNVNGFITGQSIYSNSISEHIYHWLALRDNSDGDLKFGTYVGDGNVLQAISGVGFTPNFIHIQKDHVSPYVESIWRSSTMGDSPAEGGLYRVENGWVGESYIESLDVDGFTVGKSEEASWASWANEDGITYFYMACLHGDNFQSGEYVGDGDDDRIIERAGTLAYVGVKKRVSVATQVAFMHRMDQSGVTDEGFDCGDNVALADTIQEFTGGGFEIGTHDRVNAVDAYYDWWVFGTEMGDGNGNGVHRRKMLLGVG